MDVVVFLLANTGVVETEVGEIRRLMAGGAIAGMLRAVNRSRRGLEKNLQAGEFRRSELERLSVVLE